MAYVKPHFHQAFLHAAYIIAGTAQQLGLDEPASASGLPHGKGLSLLSDTRWQSFEEVEAHLRSARTTRGKVRCVYRPQFYIRAGVPYDRPGSMECPPWRFQKHEPYTVITLLEYPPTFAPYPWWSTIPAALPMHDVFFVSGWPSNCPSHRPVLPCALRLEVRGRHLPCAKPHPHPHPHPNATGHLPCAGRESQLLWRIRRHTTCRM